MRITSATIEAARNTLGVWSVDAAELAASRAMVPGAGALHVAPSGAAIVARAHDEFGRTLSWWPTSGSCIDNAMVGALRIESLAGHAGSNAAADAIHGAMVIAGGPIAVPELARSGAGLGSHPGSWSVHAAPAALAAAGEDLMVFDRAFFDEPVPLSAWASRLGDDVPVVVRSPLTVNHRDIPGLWGVELLDGTERIPLEQVARSHEVVALDWEHAHRMVVSSPLRQTATRAS